MRWKRRSNLSRFSKQRLTADERLDRKLRRHEHLRWIKQKYVHSDELHGPFVHPGDETLVRFLELLGKHGPILAACNERHVKRIEGIGLRCVWHTERPVDPTEIMLGNVFRKPDAAGPLARLRFSTELAGAFVCERLQKQDNLHDYLVALRQAVAVDAPVALVVPNAHHELIDDHVNLFTAGTLIYSLVRAGWNCREAEVSYDGRFINVLVHRLDVPEPWPQTVEQIKAYVPFKNIFQYCTSEIAEVYRYRMGASKQRWS